MSKRKQYLTITETAAILGVSKETLRTWRYRRQGPDYFKPTPQTVLYEAGELEEFMEEHRIECRY